MFDSRNPKIGDLVYLSYNVNSAGKIISIRKTSVYTYFTVLKVNGNVYEDRAHKFNCFESLVSSHERKAANQRAIAEKLKSLSV